MKKIAKLVSAAALLAGLAGCTGKENTSITVISREEGSGTRSAFVELFEVLDENKNDNTTARAEITNNTAVMLASVAGNRNAAGYVSLGSLNNTVKALKIDGFEASAAAITSGGYKISRPFLIAIKNELSPAAEDFINFILSAEGQGVVAGNGYLPVGSREAPKIRFAPSTVRAAGSSSVSPLMEKLREAYIKKNPDIDIEIQQSDSSTGMNAVINGICDIGMASREIKSSEREKGISGIMIAMDGIAVIVHRENLLEDLTRRQIRDIFSGKVGDWRELK
ncbi:MAG: extracellular solute-binding protein [Treponema sp.]|nr:extracellular solute-binding protein [Treponema sp.]